jgi:hypothetical protein
VGIFTAARREAPFGEALGTVVAAILHSPHFLFRSELGAPADAGKANVTLTAHELATALSFFLWETTPDEGLLDAADRGALLSPETLRKEAARLLAAPRGRARARDFVQRWLGTVDEGVLAKTTDGWSDKLAASMLAEGARFIDRVLWQEDGKLATLLLCNKTTVDQRLAVLYGVPWEGGTEPREVELDAARRAGVLTQPVFLAAHTPGAHFSPINLGLAVRGRFFCQALPDPPDQVPEPSKNPELSTRERYAVHSADPGCAGCHALIDPVGFGFERYDIIGRHRDTEKVGKAGRLVPLTGEGASMAPTSMARSKAPWNWPGAWHPVAR